MERGYVSLAGWLVHNLRVYAGDVGDEDLFILVSWLSEEAWSRVLSEKVGEERLLDLLMSRCVSDPLSLDEEVWQGQMECVAGLLRPFVEHLAPKLRTLPEAIEKGLKNLAEAGNRGV